MMIRNDSQDSVTFLSECLFEEIINYTENKDLNILNNIRILLEQGASVTKSKYYDSALAYASRMNLVEIIQIFIDEGIDINSSFFNMWKLRDGKEIGFAASALHIAAECGFYDLAVLLITNNANLNCNPKSKLSPLHVAISKKFIEIIILLVEAHADLFEKDYIYDEDAFDWACDCGDEDIINYFDEIKNIGDNYEEPN